MHDRAGFTSSLHSLETQYPVTRPRWRCLVPASTGQETFWEAPEPLTGSLDQFPRDAQTCLNSRGGCSTPFTPERQESNQADLVLLMEPPTSTPPGSQASSLGEAKDSALLSSRDAYFLYNFCDIVCFSLFVFSLFLFLLLFFNIVFLKFETLL